MESNHNRPASRHADYCGNETSTATSGGGVGAGTLMVLPLNFVVLTRKRLKPWSLKEGMLCIMSLTQRPEKTKIKRVSSLGVSVCTSFGKFTIWTYVCLIFKSLPTPSQKTDWNRKQVIVSTHRVWVWDVVGVVVEQQPWHISWCSLIEGSISLQGYKYRPTHSHSLLHILVLDLALDIHLVYYLK